ncbi:hypothetical protein FRB99_002506 [Tulasnella sp. 403]|nr:hypothetical protein FRB99_002506 [Tulasnella sp. 403]
MSEAQFALETVRSRIPPKSLKASHTGKTTDQELHGSRACDRLKPEDDRPSQLSQTSRHAKQTTSSSPSNGPNKFLKTPIDHGERARLMKLFFPSSYDGTPEYDAWRSFVFDVKVWLEIAQLPQEYEMVAIKMFLTGRALRHYLIVAKPNLDAFTIGTYLKALFDHCFPSDFWQKARQEFYQCVQGDRTTREYWQELDHLGYRLSYIDKDQIRVQYWKGSAPYIRAGWISAGFDPETTSLEELRRVAEGHERAEVMRQEAETNMSSVAHELVGKLQMAAGSPAAKRSALQAYCDHTSKLREIGPAEDVEREQWTDLMEANALEVVLNVLMEIAPVDVDLYALDILVETFDSEAAGGTEYLRKDVKATGLVRSRLPDIFEKNLQMISAPPQFLNGVHVRILESVTLSLLHCAYVAIADFYTPLDSHSVISFVITTFYRDSDRDKTLDLHLVEVGTFLVSHHTVFQRTWEILCNDEYYKESDGVAPMIGTCIMITHLASTDALGIALMENAKIHLHLFKRCWLYIAKHHAVSASGTNQVLEAMLRSALALHDTSKAVPRNKATVILDLMKEQHLIMLLGRVLLAERPLYEMTLIRNNTKDRRIYDQLSKLVVQVSKENPEMRNEAIKPPWEHILTCIQDLIYDGAHQSILGGHDNFQDALRTSPQSHKLQVWRDFGKELGLDEVKFMEEGKADSITAGCSWNAPTAHCVDASVFRLQKGESITQNRERC